MSRTERVTVGIVRWSERTKEVGGGRRPTEERSGTVNDRHRFTDEQTKYPRNVANAEK